MKLIDDYFEIQKQIYEYFGYVEDWCVFPLDDSRDYYWYINGDEVKFAKSLPELRGEEGDSYTNSIFHQRFLPKAIYRGAEYTMIVVDTHTDGNKFLQVFDNSKEQHE